MRDIFFFEELFFLSFYAGKMKSPAPPPPSSFTRSLLSCFLNIFIFVLFCSKYFAPAPFFFRHVSGTFLAVHLFFGGGLSNVYHKRKKLDLTNKSCSSPRVTGVYDTVPVEIPIFVILAGEKELH